MNSIIHPNLNSGAFIRSPRERRLLMIGPGETLDDQIRRFCHLRAIEPVVYTSFDTPPDELLGTAEILYVYDVDLPARLDQLRACCEHQRRCGEIKFIFGLSRRFSDLGKPANRELALRVLAAGAMVLPLFESPTADAIGS
jgi:hypothetical protein